MITTKKSDREFNVNLPLKENISMLITGRSRTGKTCCMTSMIKPIADAGYRILILDISGSFDDGELRKARFYNSDGLMSKMNITETPFSLGISKKECSRSGLSRKLCDYIRDSCSVNGQIQDAILSSGCKKFLADSNDNLKNLKSYLTEKGAEDKSEEDTKEHCGSTENAEKLVQRIRPICENDFFKVTPGNSSLDHKAPILLVQLADLDDKTKEAVISIILQEVWSLANEKSLGKYLVVLDEFQMISLNGDSILSKIIRQGKKRQLDVMLATQYLTDRNKEEQAALDQITTRMYFAPSVREIKKIAQMIDFERFNEWVRILHNLEVGNAVLCGTYHVGFHQDDTPIVIKVHL